MTKLLVIALALAACGDNIPVVLGQDFAPDAGMPEVDARACVAPPDAGPTDCCRFAPDTGAIGACAAPSFPPDTCGVVGCQLADCSFVRVNVCGVHSIDAGVDGGP